MFQQIFLKNFWMNSIITSNVSQKISPMRNKLLRLFEYVVCGIIGFELHILYLQHKQVPPREESSLLSRTSATTFEYKQPTVENGCYIAATGFKDAYEAHMQLKGNKHQARLMYVSHISITGHALCVFQYGGTWHAYDSRFGSIKLGVFEKMPEPQVVAELVDLTYLNPQWYP